MQFDHWKDYIIEHSIYIFDIRQPSLEFVPFHSQKHLTAQKSQEVEIQTRIKLITLVKVEIKVGECNRTDLKIKKKYSGDINIDEFSKDRPVCSRSYRDWIEYQKSSTKSLFRS